MEIIVGKTAGFCFGVSNAITKTEKELEKSKEIYCLGELAHNKQVVEQLAQKGVIFINEIKDAKEKLIIRAHGISKQIYEEAKLKDIELIDLTCPKVLKIHNIAEEYAKNEFYIFLMGEANHAETIGTVSYCGQYFSIIEDILDVEQAIKDLNTANKKDILIISQTTFSLEKFNRIVDEIKSKIPSNNIKIINTLCEATKKRQEETVQIAKQVELMIIIGGKNSSNTRKLYEVSQKHCENVILIETREELDLDNIEKFEKIGIMAGASTPKKSVDEVVELLTQL